MSDILFLTQERKFCRFAIELFSQYYPSTKVIMADRHRGTGKHFDDLGPEYELVVSFLFPFRVPRTLIDRSKLSVNFHPGSAHYPGVGCVNFALYEGARVYGAVCHHMEETFDTGGIIFERTFPILDADNVEKIQFRTWITLLGMLHEFCCRHKSGEQFSQTSRWMRKPFTKRELNELASISSTMSPAEITKRIRATSYPGYQSKFIFGDLEISATLSGENAAPLIERIMLDSWKPL